MGQIMVPILGFVVCCIGLLRCGDVQAAAGTRVALVSTCESETARNVLALAEVELGQNDLVSLVERREVERVLAEQNLVQCGLSNPKQAVATGKWLGAELFASLESYASDTKAMALVVFDARNGAVLWDATLPSDDVRAMASNVASAVTVACQKRLKAGGASKTICLMTARNSGLPRELDSLVESVGLLLERRLLESDHLAVLDRRHLESVNKERRLPTGEPDGKLFGALVSMELDVAAGSTADAMRALLVLRGADGNELGRIDEQVAGRNAVALVEVLANKVARMVGDAPLAGQRAGKEEAGRYYQEAKFWEEHKQLGKGLQAAEVAVALDPTNVRHLMKLAWLLGHQGQAVLKQPDDGLVRGLKLAVRSVQVTDEAWRHMGVPGKEIDWAVADNVFLETEFLRDAIALTHKAGPEAPALFEDFRSEYRRHYRAVLSRPMEQLALNGNELLSLTMWLRKSGATLEMIAPSGQEWSDDLLAGYDVWLQGVAKFGWTWQWELHCQRYMIRLCYLARTGKRIESLQLHPWRIGASERQKLRDLFMTMSQHKRPLAQVYGNMGLLADSVGAGGIATAQQSDQYRAIEARIHDNIANARPDSSAAYIKQWYAAAQDLVDLFLDDPRARREAYDRLFALMLDQRHLEYWTIRMMTDPEAHRFHHYDGVHFKYRYVDGLPCESNEWATEHYPGLLANARRVLRLHRSLDVRNINMESLTWYTGSVELELAKYREPIERALPDLVEQTEAPWSRASLLFNAGKGSRERTLCGLVKAGRTVHAALRETDSQGRKTVAHLAVSLDGVQATISPSFPLDNDAVTCSAWDDGAFYVGTTRQGVIAFPGNDVPPFVIDQTAGLPANHVQALSILGGKLYVALHGGYLVVHDLGHGQTSILASSRRKSPVTPLDNTAPPFGVTSMLADTKRNRVLFLVTQGTNTDCTPILGLWAVDGATRQVAQLTQFYRWPRWMTFSSPDALMVYFRKAEIGFATDCKGAHSGIVTVDLASGKSVMPYSHLYAQQLRHARPAGPEIRTDDPLIPLTWMASNPCLIVDGWLWYTDWDANTWKRLGPDGTIVQRLPNPDTTQTGPGSITPGLLELVTDGAQRSMLVANKNRIWLLDLPEVPRAEPANLSALTQLIARLDDPKEPVRQTAFRDLQTMLQDASWQRTPALAYALQCAYQSAHAPETLFRLHRLLFEITPIELQPDDLRVDPPSTTDNTVRRDILHLTEGTTARATVRLLPGRYRLTVKTSQPPDRATRLVVALGEQQVEANITNGKPSTGSGNIPVMEASATFTLRVAGLYPVVLQPVGGPVDVTRVKLQLLSSFPQSDDHLLEQSWGPAAADASHILLFHFPNILDSPMGPFNQAHVSLVMDKESIKEGIVFHRSIWMTVDWTAELAGGTIKIQGNTVTGSLDIRVTKGSVTHGLYKLDFSGTIEGGLMTGDATVALDGKPLKKTTFKGSCIYPGGNSVK